MNFEKMAREFIKSTEFVRPCKFAGIKEIEKLPFRWSPYWYVIHTGRHIGVHRADDRTCNWTARVLTKDKLYEQKCLGPALDLGRGQINFKIAMSRAFEWFESGKIQAMASEPKLVGRTKAVNFCPIGDVYSVGHALKDYSEWTRIARSKGGHYNNLVLVNYHIVPNFAQIPLEEFSAKHLRNLAVQVLETPPKLGFMEKPTRVDIDSLTPDELRRRKRTFNSLISILRMAFRHAWNNGAIESERPIRCLKRVSVNHTPRTIFLDRSECHKLLDACTPALKRLVMAALYSGCRVGELGSLIVDDIGKQGFGIRVRAFKRSPARFVFLPDEGMSFFLDCCEGKSGQDPVLLSDMGKVWTKQHSQLFRRAVAQAGLPGALVFHGLRHTYASDLVRAGVPLDIVAKQLGHASSITVSKTYGHLAEQFREEQIRERFTPLSDVQCAKLADHRDRLNKLWTTLQPDDWRKYGHVDIGVHQPSKSFANPVKEVLDVFNDAENVIKWPN